MLRSFVQSRARPLRAEPAGRPSCSQATSSRVRAPVLSRPRAWRIVAAGGRADGRRRRDTPAPGPLHIIGGQAAGCIAGAVRLPARGAGLPDHPPVAQFLLGRALDHRAHRDAGRAGARGRTGRSLRRGHLAATRRTDAGRASQPSAWSRRRCRPGRDAEARADRGGARDGGAAEYGAPGSARHRSGALDARTRSRCCIWPRACRRWTAS